jgi:O-antigen/teichoic acid export membrane protein
MERAGGWYDASSFVSKLTRNIAYNLGGQLMLVVLSFAAARYVFRGLGRDALGLIYFAQTLNAIIVAVADVGVGATVVKEVSANERDPAYVKLVVRSGSAFAWIAYAVFSTAFIVAMPWIVDHWIALEHLDRASAIAALRVLVASTLLTIPQMFYSSVFRGKQAMGPPNAVDVGAVFVQHVGTAVLASRGHGVETVVWWIAGTYVIRLIVLTLLAGAALSWSALRPVFDGTVFRRMKRAALAMLAISVLGIIHSQTDKIIISSTLPIASIGVYGLLYGALGRGGILSGAVVQGALPVFSSLVSAGRRDELRLQFRRLQTLTCYALVPFYALVAIGSRLLFTQIFEADTAATLVAPAYLLALGFYLHSTMHVPYFLTVADNRPDIAMRFNLFALGVTLPVTLVLTWKLGFLGAGIAWLWYSVFGYLYFIPRACRECLEVPVLQSYRQAFEPLALAVMSYGTLGVVLYYFDLRSLVAFGVGFSVASLVYLAASWWRIGPPQRAEVAQWVRGRLGRAQREAISP